MRTFIKVDGVIYEEEKFKDNSISSSNVMDTLINYDEVDKSTYNLSSRAVKTIAKRLTSPYVEKFYELIINAKTRQDLINVLNKMCDVCFSNVLNKKSTFAMYSETTREQNQRLRNQIGDSMDTSLYTMVNEIIRSYYKYEIEYIMNEKPEVYDKLIKCYRYDSESIASTFTNIDKIQDEDIKNHVIYVIKNIFKHIAKTSYPEHLCFDCPAGYPSKCPKIYDCWPHHLGDYDFITDGVEIQYEANDKKAPGDEDTEVKSFIVTKCKLEEKYRAKMKSKK